MNHILAIAALVVAFVAIIVKLFIDEQTKLDDDDELNIQHSYGM